MRYTSFILFILFSIQMISEGSVIPEFKIIRQPDPCGQNKTLILGIYAGELTAEDKFYGFDVEFTFENDKLQYNSVLTNNTFSEYFIGEFSGVVHGSSNDTVFANGGLVTGGPLTGDRNLVAFSFNYLGDPNDTLSFTFNYLYMGSEFVRTVDLDLVIDDQFHFPPLTYKSAELFTADTVKFQDGNAVINLQLNSNLSSKLDNMNLNCSLKSFYSISDIVYDNDIIGNYNINNDILNVSLDGLSSRSTNNILSIFLTQEESITNNEIFNIEVQSFNKNSCVKKIDNVDLILVPDLTSSIEDNNSDKIIINKYYYDTLGKLIYKGLNKIDMNGNYILIYEYQDGTFENKYLIN